uniref:lysozyme n=1 Tax=Podarcis muralis TaxID=64176 RepID=A0A670KAR9_PODMU
MKTLHLLSFCLLMVANETRKFEDCELFYKLRDLGLDGFRGIDVKQWICLVSHTSGFNTSALNVGPTASNYGIFLLSGRWWCRDAKTLDTRNHCNLSCGGKNEVPILTLTC